ncbi:MAG: flagellar hook-length control protein FliK [Phycisphaerae bacterium]
MISFGSPNHETGVTGRHVQTGQAVASPRRPQAPDEVTLDVVPFGALLESFASPAGPNRARGGAASSFGVFESGNASGHEQRQAALREGQATRRVDAQTRYEVDRTGVAARRLDHMDTRGSDSKPAGQTTASEPNTSDALRLAARRLTPGSSDGRGNAAAPVSNRAHARIEPGRPAGAQSQTEFGGRNGFRGASANAAAPEVAQVHGATSMAPAAPSGSGSTDVAHEIARSLGASRVGGVESARAPTGSAQTGFQRAGRQDAPKGGRAVVGSRSEKADSTLQARSGKELEPTPFDRLVRSIRMQAGAHRSRAKMMLDPPELGRVMVDVAMVGDTIEVRVRAERSHARELLQDRVAKLRRALREQGIEIERFTVSSDWPDRAVAAESEGSGQRHERDSGAVPPSRRLKQPRDVDRNAAQGAGPKNEESARTVRSTVAERRIDVRI